MTKHRIIALAATCAVAGGGAAAAAAATSHPAHPGPAVQFQHRLAQQLGVSDAKLAAAGKASGLATVEALKASGKLPAARAARLEQAIRAGRAAPFMQLGRRAGRGGAVKLLARQLGITPQALRAQVKAGRTPAEIIVAAGKDQATARAAVQAAIRARLEKGVKAGRLTAAQADARAQKRAVRLTGDQPLGRRG